MATRAPTLDGKTLSGVLAGATRFGGSDGRPIAQPYRQIGLTLLTEVDVTSGWSARGGGHLVVRLNIDLRDQLGIGLTGGPVTQLGLAGKYRAVLGDPVNFDV